MPITNNNLVMIDRPMWEQLTNAPTNSAAGACMDGDGVRFIYTLASASSFWAYDTWADTWQQLASPPGGTVAAGTSLEYVAEMGSQVDGVVYGSVYAFITSGTAVVFYRYDIGSNTWSSALSVTNVPATFGTDSSLIAPEPRLNAYQGGYHSNVALNTITASANAIIGATTISVSALPLALPSGAVLNFGTAIAPIWAVLTAAAAASATSITVSPLVAQVNSASVAYFYADMFLFGNNATTVYRYNIASNAWLLTSANAGNPTLAVATGTLGVGHGVEWYPGSGDVNALNMLCVHRGTGSSTHYEYNIATNAWSTVAIQPATETFTTGTSFGSRFVNNKLTHKVIEKDITGRFYQVYRTTRRIIPITTQNLIGNGAALVGNRVVVMSNSGIDFVYYWLSTSSYFLRSGLFF